MGRDVVPAPGGHIVFRVTAHRTDKSRSAEPEMSIPHLKVVPLHTGSQSGMSMMPRLAIMTA